MTKRNELHCPNCKATFDVGGIFDVWKRDFFEKIEEIAKQEKEK